MPLEDAVDFFVQVPVVVDDGGFVGAGTKVVVIDVFFAVSLILPVKGQNSRAFSLTKFLPHGSKPSVFFILIEDNNYRFTSRKLFFHAYTQQQETSL